MAYAVRDSGAREKYDSGMLRDVNADKPRFDLITPTGIPYDEQVLVRWGHLMREGAVKYGERNWEKAEGGTELSRFRESAFRHFMQWYLGADDVEDHAVAVLFNISGAELVKWKTGQRGSSQPDPR